jgi:hypothetical protein
MELSFAAACTTPLAAAVYADLTWGEGAFWIVFVIGQAVLVIASMFMWRVMKFRYLGRAKQ